MQSTHLTALSAKHSQLDQRIHAETLRPVPDGLILADLKKQKLRIKEEMGR